ncbi:TPR repeat-containing protein [Cryptosporidium muris RN66]|uniref:Signal recognition particle subunit SRP72 n=1 Tax=Cryptosporidium muris (strain RN66) TaxID=441375 RepID=B6AEX6_CRYMR|nr:TPR repeat-containing protein [Cryptosporidium muris RN66]EEA06743.1 TPR repeat-containing protein [Cryptosporidium muris RN66]|eukprot:XP_002141092.1 TPR repeat-containing protein [Cryptosporidium muris RN66]
MHTTGELYKELHELVDSEQYEIAINICNKLKALGCNNEDVLRTKIYCLIQRGKWHQAINYIDLIKGRFSTDLFYERSYCLYRMNRLEEALKCLDSFCVKSTNFVDTSILHLKAQIFYLMGRFQECECLYKNLIGISDHNNAEEQMLLSVNHVAVQASDENLSIYSNYQEDQSYIFFSSYEYWFNLACLHIVNKEYEKAVRALNKSQEIYMTANPTQSEEKEYNSNKSDMCSFKLCRAYIFQQIGEYDKALNLYTCCIEEYKLNGIFLESSIVQLAVVAFNNMISLQTRDKSDNYIDGLNRLTITSKENFYNKLISSQKFSICLNKAFSCYSSPQYNRYIRDAEKFTVYKTKLELFKVGIYMLQGKEKKALSSLEYLHKQSPENLAYSNALLSLAIKLKSFKNIPRFIDIILSQYIKVITKEYKSNTDWISSSTFEHLIRLLIYTKMDKVISISTIIYKLDTFCNSLKQALNTKEGAINNNIIAEILNILGNTFLCIGMFSKSVECFSTALNITSSNDMSSVIGLVISASLNNNSNLNLKQYLRILDNKLPSSMFSIDPETLERSEIPNIPHSSNNLDSEPVLSVCQKSKSKHHKRKIRYPKGFDLNNPGPYPDPERWLPKEERSSFKKLHKTKNQRNKGTLQKGGHQGAIPTSDTSFRNKGPSTAKKEVDTDNNHSRRQRRKRR